jgi:hypothetical protein
MKEEEERSKNKKGTKGTFLTEAVDLLMNCVCVGLGHTSQCVIRASVLTQHLSGISKKST